MKSLLRKLLLLVILVIGAMGIGRLWYFAKDGFSINRIACSLPQRDNEEESPIAELLQQNFRYLGRGRQCYAFESEDQKIVLKFPRFDRYQLPFRWKALSLNHFNSIKTDILKDRQKRLCFTIDSFKIASEKFQEETALLYSHFHRTEHLPKECVLKDSLGRSYLIDLNRVGFVLQEKVPLMIPLLIEAIKQEDVEQSQAILLSFLDLIDRRAKLGIFNKDPSFRRNFGWDNRAIQIDIGSFYQRSDLSKQTAYSRSMLEGTGPFKEWLKEHNAPLSEWFNLQFEQAHAAGAQWFNQLGE